MHIPPHAAPYSRQPEIGRSELYMGCLFAWLATAEDTPAGSPWSRRWCRKESSPAARAYP
jgi:hypothetical protein